MRRLLRLSRPWCAALVLSAAVSTYATTLSAQQPQSAGGFSGQGQNPGNARQQPGSGAQPGGTYQMQMQQQQAARPGAPSGANPGTPAAQQRPVATGNGAATGTTPGNAAPNAAGAPAPGAGEIMQMSPEQAALALSKQPFPPLSPQYQQFLDQVLTLWEERTKGVTQYECTFKRYQYDPTLQTEDAFTIAHGVLKYSQPDKGLFRVDKLYQHSGRDANNQPQYKTIPNRNGAGKDEVLQGEYWICDGQYIHMMDRDKKICTKIELPPEMRGKAIYNSPLPFLFGVNAQQIKERYWIQPLAPPPDRKNEVWLEAYPRFPNDAANFQRVQVVIDQSDWMPKGLIVFTTNWRPQAPHRELYEFENRKNLSGLASKMNPLNMLKEFIPEDPPADWKTVIEPYEAPQAQPIQQSSEPRVAQPPQNQPNLK